MQMKPIAEADEWETASKSIWTLEKVVNVLIEQGKRMEETDTYQMCISCSIVAGCTSVDIDCAGFVTLLRRLGVEVK